MSTSEQLSTTLPKPQEAQWASLPQDVIPQLSPIFYKTIKRARADQRTSMKNQEARHRSLTAMKEQKYSSIKSKISHKGTVPVKSSPDTMLALSAAEESKTIPGEHGLQLPVHLNDENETPSDNEVDLTEDLSLPGVALSERNISQCRNASSGNFALKCPYRKEFECSLRKESSQIDSRKDMKETDCDLRHSFISTNTGEILPTQYNTNSKKAHYSENLELSRLLNFPLRSSVRNKRCAEAGKQVTCRSSRVISKEALGEQETRSKWVKVRGLSQRPHVTDSLCRLNGIVRQRRTRSATLSEKNQRLQKNINLPGDPGVRIKPRPHSHSRHVSDSQTNIHVAHEERQRHNRKYLRKPTSRISVESNESSCMEISSTVARQSSPAKHENSFQDNGCLKRLKHINQPCTKRREKEDSTYSDETTPHHLQECKTYLNQKSSRSKVRPTSRKRLFLRARSASRPNAQPLSESLPDFVLNKSPHINRKKLSFNQETVKGNT